VRVIDRLLHAAVEPRVIQNDFSGMHRFDGVGLNDGLASILDVDTSWLPSGETSRTAPDSSPPS
jgi:hypothetical protein